MNSKDPMDTDRTVEPHPRGNHDGGNPSGYSAAAGNSAIDGSESWADSDGRVDPAVHPAFRNANPPKSYTLTWALSQFLGGLGADRFYLGKIGTGIAKLLTAGGLGLWTLVDLVIHLAGHTKDADGVPVRGTRKERTITRIITAVLVTLSLVASAMTLWVTFRSVDRDAWESRGTTVGTGSPSESLGQSDPMSGEAALERLGGRPTTDAEYIAWATATFGTYEPITESFEGEREIALPAQGVSHIVHAVYRPADRSSNGTVTMVTEDDSVVLNSTLGIGNNTMTDVIMGAVGEPRAEKLIYSGDGEWFVSIKPVAMARDFSAAGDKNAVMAYTDEAQSISVQPEELERPVYVAQVTSGSSRLVAWNDPAKEQQPSHEPTGELVQGPSVILVAANGKWRLQN